MPPTVVDLRDSNVPPPGFLLIDASVLLAIRSLPGHAPSSRSQAATQFLTRIQQAYQNGDAIPLVCALTLEECYFKIIRSKFENDPNLGSGNWHQLYKDNSQQIQNYFPDVQAFYQWIIGIPLTVVEPEDLADPKGVSPSIEQRMRHYVQSCCILPKDAFLIAVAERLGVQHIATLDSDFKRLGAGFTIYTLL
jgi:predicted nucleic acid-binding protein